MRNARSSFRLRYVHGSIAAIQDFRDKDVSKVDFLLGYTDGLGRGNGEPGRGQKPRETQKSDVGLTREGRGDDGLENDQFLLVEQRVPPTMEDTRLWMEFVDGVHFAIGSLLWPKSLI